LIVIELFLVSNAAKSIGLCQIVTYAERITRFKVDPGRLRRWIEYCVDRREGKNRLSNQVLSSKSLASIQTNPQARAADVICKYKHCSSFSTAEL